MDTLQTKARVNELDVKGNELYQSVADNLYPLLVDKFNINRFVSNYQDFSSATLNQGNIDDDTVFNKIFRDDISSQQTTAIDATSGFNFWKNKLYYVLLDLTVHKLDFLVDVMMNPGNSMNTNGNYAVRLHNFNAGDSTRYMVYSIVNVVDGVEHYRLHFNNDVTMGLAEYLRNTKKVVDGVVDQTTPLSTSDIFNIISCFTVEIEGYSYWDNYIAATRDSTNAADAANAILQFNKDRARLPFQDGNSGNIKYQRPRLYAVDKPENSSHNYLFGWSFLPFNDTKYNIFEFKSKMFLGPSPWTKQNLTTILKLIALGITFFELLGMLIRY